jgi:hypothetical protein
LISVVAGVDDQDDGRAPKLAGNGSPKLGIVARVQLAQRLAVARAEPTPVPWATLAAQEGLSVSQCHRVLNDYLAEDLRLGDPLGLVRETLGVFGCTIEMLGDLAEAESTHATVKVGAARLLLEALGARIQLLVAAGMMPRRLSAQRDHDDAVILVTKMAEVIRAHDLGDDIVDELLAVVGGTAAEQHPTNG